MSQPCSLIELVLVDARDLASAGCLALLAAARERGTHIGALAPAGDVAAIADAAGAAPDLDFWLAGDGTWPFARASALSGAEPGRTLFASSDRAARTSAGDAGLLADADALETYLRLMP